MWMKLVRIFKRALKNIGYIILFFMIIMVMTILPNFTKDSSDNENPYDTYIESRVVGDIFVKDPDNYKSRESSPDSYYVIQSILTDAYNERNPLLRIWKNKTRSYCGGKIDVAAKTLFRVKDIVIDTSLIFAKAIPGIDVKDAKDQKDGDEYYSFAKGAFQMNCSNPLPEVTEVLITDENIPHMRAWYKSITTNFNGKPGLNVWFKTVTEPVYIVVRSEYANVYWVLVDIYDVFVHCLFNGHNPSDVTVLLLDAHAKSSLDEMWKIVFRKVLRLNDLTGLAHFKDLTYTITRTFSPFDQGSPYDFRQLLDSKDLPAIVERAANNNVMPEWYTPIDEDTAKKYYIPYFNHLRSFIWSRFNVHNVLSYPMCKTLRVTFVWRRNYVAHPRNPYGIVSRKIANEDEIIDATRKAYPSWEINGYQLDPLPMTEQIKILSQTDIMIGMHGAAFALSFLISPGGGVIELFPIYHFYNDHMFRIAVASGLHYQAWTNRQPEHENIYKKTTKVPPEKVIGLLQEMSKHVCNRKKKRGLRDILNHRFSPSSSLNMR